MLKVARYLTFITDTTIDKKYFFYLDRNNKDLIVVRTQVEELESLALQLREWVRQMDSVMAALSNEEGS